MRTDATPQERAICRLVHAAGGSDGMGVILRWMRGWARLDLQREEVLRLHLVENMRPAEIANQTGIQTRRIKRWIGDFQRAMRRLARDLSEHGPNAGARADQ